MERPHQIGIAAVAFAAGCALRMAVFASTATAAPARRLADPDVETRIASRSLASTSEASSPLDVSAPSAPSSAGTVSGAAASNTATAVVRSRQNFHDTDEFVSSFRRLCDVHDAEETFARVYGSFPTSPLAVPAKEYEAWRIQAPAGNALSESYLRARARLSAVNRGSPNPAFKRRNGFQALSYQADGELITLVGRDMRGITVSFQELTWSLASLDDRPFDALPDLVQEQLRTISEEWFVGVEGHRRELWSLIRARALQKVSQNQHERNVVAFRATGTEPPHLIRRGEVPELDALIDDRDRLALDTRRRVEAALLR